MIGIDEPSRRIAPAVLVRAGRVLQAPGRPAFMRPREGAPLPSISRAASVNPAPRTTVSCLRRLSLIGHYVACDVGLLTIRRPRLHQLAPLFQRVAAPVRLLGLVANRMRKGGLGNLAGTWSHPQINRERSSGSHAS